MTLLRLGLLGWLAGLLAYLGALALFYGQGISRGDLGAVVAWSLVAFAICYLLLYLPVLRALHRWLPHPRSAWVFPVVAVLLGVVPTALIARVAGGSLRALLSPEALLFGVLFTAVGVVVGVGFTRLERPK